MTSHRTMASTTATATAPARFTHVSRTSRLYARATGLWGGLMGRR
jgi:hypothetical protein